jgi:hypothetical protein
MDQGPLVNEQINAGASFLSTFQKYAPVRTAFWLKDGETGEWNLYVVSDTITDENIDKAYREVGRIAKDIHDPWFDPFFQIKVAGVHHPLAKLVGNIQRKVTGRVPPGYHGGQLGMRSVAELYIYPLPITVPATL